MDTTTTLSKEKMFSQLKEHVAREKRFEVEVRQLLTNPDLQDCLEIAMIRLFRLRQRQEPHRYRHYHGEDWEIRDMQYYLKHTHCELIGMFSTLFQSKDMYPAAWNLLPIELQTKATEAIDLRTKNPI